MTIAIRNKCDWQCCCDEKWLCVFFPALPPRLNSCGLCLFSQPFSHHLLNQCLDLTWGRPIIEKLYWYSARGRWRGKNTLLFTVNRMEWDTKSACEQPVWLIVSMLLARAWEWLEGFVVYCGLTMTCCLAGNKLWGNEKWCWQGTNTDKTGGFVWWATVQGGCTSQMTIELNWKNVAVVLMWRCFLQTICFRLVNVIHLPPTLFLNI